MMKIRKIILDISKSFWFIGAQFKDHVLHLALPDRVIEG